MKELLDRWGGIVSRGKLVIKRGKNKSDNLIAMSTLSDEELIVFGAMFATEFEKEREIPIPREFPLGKLRKRFLNDVAEFGQFLTPQQSSPHYDHYVEECKRVPERYSEGGAYRQSEFLAYGDQKRQLQRLAYESRKPKSPSKDLDYIPLVLPTGEGGAAETHNVSARAMASVKAERAAVSEDEGETPPLPGSMDPSGVFGLSWPEPPIGRSPAATQVVLTEEDLRKINHHDPRLTKKEESKEEPPNEPSGIQGFAEAVPTDMNFVAATKIQQSLSVANYFRKAVEKAVLAQTSLVDITEHAMKLAEEDTVSHFVSTIPDIVEVLDSIRVTQPEWLAVVMPPLINVDP